MPLNEPVEGRCNAKLRGRRAGQFCANRPRKGEKRCRKHGSGSAANPGGRPLIHGAYSQRFAREAEPTQKLIDQALQDPELLDVRRPVALQAVLVQELGMVPTDATIRQLALSYFSQAEQREAQREGRELEPTEAMMELARRAFIDRSMEAVERYQRAVVAAARQAKVGELISAELLPLFEDLGRRLSVLCDKYVAERDRESFRAAFRRETRHVLLRAATVGEDG